MDRAFVIGDVQGLHVKLRRLLEQEGLLEGDKRLQPDVDVISLGDLGHFASYPMGKENIFPYDDEKCFELLENDVIDFMLWGNHDRPVTGLLRRDEYFGGYFPPSPEFAKRIRALWGQQRIRLAHMHGDILLTHAGLAPFAGMEEENIPKLVSVLNKYDQELHHNGVGSKDYYLHAVTDGIGWSRGGSQPWGGILWRNAHSEKLFDGVRQIFGHTVFESPQTFNSQAGASYCLDISKYGGIAAMWLPEERIVTI